MNFLHNSISSRLVSKLQGTCTRVSIFKIFMCFILHLQRTVWILDLKCSQRQKCKYLLWPLFRTPHAYWVLSIMFAFMSFHLVFAFLYLVSLLCYYYLFHIIILSKNKNKKYYVTFSYNIPNVLFKYNFLYSRFQIWVLFELKILFDIYFFNKIFSWTLT